MKKFRNILNTLIFNEKSKLTYVILLLSLNCISLKKNQIPQPSPTQGGSRFVVFRTEQLPKNNSSDYYSLSYKAEYLIIGEKITILIRVFLGTPSDDILGTVKNVFKENLPNYRVRETIHFGSPIRKTEGNRFFIQFQNVIHRNSSGTNPENLGMENEKSELEECQLRLILKPKIPNMLWKEEEFLVENGKKRVWKNIDGDEMILPSISFSEYFTDGIRTISKIHSKTDYIYQLHKIDDLYVPFSNLPSGTLGWEVLDDFLDLELKNSLPKLRFKKNLNSYGN